MNTWAGKKPRVQLIDSLRGLALLSMIVYHGCYDAVSIFGLDWPWFDSHAAYIWQQSILWTFLLLSGVSCHFSRDSLKRGLIVLACGLLITVVTCLFLPQERILFGVLHLIGCAMILFALGKRFWQRIPPWAGAIACICLFLLTRPITGGYLWLGPFGELALPAVLYEDGLFFALGFPGPQFWSADYVPLLPWFFLFMTGYYLWPLLRDRAPLQRVFALRLPLLAALGRRSLPVYLIHQPLLMAVLYLLFLIL